MALRYCHFGYVLEDGRIVMGGDAAALRENENCRSSTSEPGARGRRSAQLPRREEHKRWLA